jgi:hypothetical protein
VKDHPLVTLSSQTTTSSTPPADLHARRRRFQLAVEQLHAHRPAADQRLARTRSYPSDARRPEAT